MSFTRALMCVCLCVCERKRERERERERERKVDSTNESKEDCVKEKALVSSM